MLGVCQDLQHLSCPPYLICWACRNADSDTVGHMVYSVHYGMQAVTVHTACNIAYSL